jgi:hypothetical protein
MNRVARFLSRLWVVLTLIWWAALVVFFVSAGVAFEVPDDLARRNAANAMLGSERCQKNNAPPECWRALLDQMQLDEKTKDTPTPNLIFNSFKERAGLVAMFIVPPLLVYAHGAALFWVCLPLTRRAGDLREKRGVPEAPTSL